MNETINITLWAVLAFMFWTVVAVGAGLAVLSRDFDDTLLERIGLSAVCLASVGAACRVVSEGQETSGDAILAGAIAFYVLAVLIKHLRSDT